MGQGTRPWLSTSPDPLSGNIGDLKIQLWGYEANQVSLFAFASRDETRPDFTDIDDAEVYPSLEASFQRTLSVSDEGIGFVLDGAYTFREAVKKLEEKNVNQYYVGIVVCL